MIASCSGPREARHEAHIAGDRGAHGARVGESRGTHSGGLQLGGGAEFEALEEEGADGGVDGVECEGEEAGDRHVWWDNVPEEAEDGGEGVLRAREREERRVPQDGLERNRQVTLAWRGVL